LVDLVCCRFWTCSAQTWTGQVWSDFGSPLLRAARLQLQ